MKCNRWDFPFITENIVAMVRVTQPTNEEIGYKAQCKAHNIIFLFISEDADFELFKRFGVSEEEMYIINSIIENNESILDNLN